LKILFLTFYFQPDLCAGSYRNTPLVEQLKTKLDDESRIDVVTTIPNRYKNFATKSKIFESDGIVNIYRIDVGVHNSGMLDQSRSFIKYFLGIKKIVKDQEYDLVYASSSRLMTAFIGSLISKKKNIPLFLDIRDIFLDTINDVLPKIFYPIINIPIFFIEKFTFNQATKVNLISKGFVSYFKKKFPNLSYSFYPNGVDEQFLNIDFKKQPNSKKKKIMLYAGNIGKGQGLDKIIPDLSIKLSKYWDFKIIGNGGEIKKLEQKLYLKNVQNVEILQPVSREKLIQEYIEADCLFLHLNTYEAFKKVLPSKIFEYAATGKPILGGLKGFSQEFINNEIDNAQTFEPTEHIEAIKKLKKLKFKLTNRNKFIKNYNRSNQMKLMSDDIIKTIK
tara:strand:- start:111 stop:1280 length:1170 start_codon:yes stop_codon:yes gene_type:complete